MVTPRASYTCPRCTAVSAHPDDAANRYCGRCHLFAGDLAGLRCPLCGQPPALLLGGGTQAFCGTDDCKIVTWNPTLTFDELFSDMAFIDLSSWVPGNGADRDGGGQSGPGDALA